MKNRKLLLSIFIGLIIGIILATGLAFYKKSIHGKFPEGTYVANINLSRKTPEEGEKILESAKTKYLKTPLKITILGKTKEFTPEALGVNISTKETIRTLKEINAKKIRIWEIFGLNNQQNEKLDLVVQINYDTLFAGLEKNFELKKIEPQPATFFFDENKKLAIRDGKEGVTINKKELIQNIKNAARALEPIDIKVETFNKMPTVTREKLTEQEARITEALNQQINLIDPVYSDNWHIKLKDHLDWVKFALKEEVKLPFSDQKIIIDPPENYDGEQIVTIEIDQQKLNEFIDTNISKWLDRPAEQVNIYTNKEGKVIIEGKGDDGKKVQRQFLKESIELALINKIQDVPIPVINITPKINISEDLQEKGIKEKISVGHTSYYGSPANRVHNIKVGAARFNGLLLAPDEFFNFNKSLGQVDESTGFKKELVIKKEGTIPEYGGGICQVSTTMFRAALFAGLQIVERNQHTYAVTYYSQILGHGLDATIYLGGANLKFKNDTGKYILIQTYVDKDYELYIVFYGTPDGRRVEMEGPYISNSRSPGPTEYVETTDLPPGTKKQVEKPHTGFNALWYRHLFDKDGKETKEPISTQYKAIPGKILIGVEPSAIPPEPTMPATGVAPTPP